MMTIFKYAINVTNVSVVEMPVNADILCVQVQNGEPFLWAVVSDLAPKIPRIIETFGTGHRMPNKDRRKYIGTYQLEGGALVFHVFERI